MPKILAINGSYRENGITDQTVLVMAQTLQQSDADIDIVTLRDYPIEFCVNCRHCTQEGGESPGVCIHHDGMQDLVNRIEAADAYILASPTNFGTVTAIFKRFMERLTVYAYWPWGTPAPQFRKAKSARKKAVIVASSSAPGLMGRLFFDTSKRLKYTAKVIGADTAGILFTGMVCSQADQKISQRTKDKARLLAMKLLP